MIIVNAGVAGIIASAFWGIQDYTALVQANQRLERSATTVSERQFQLLAHRENTHRINVGFDGTWLLLSGILAAVGYTVGKK